MTSREFLKNFKYDHLPPFLQDISKPFSDLANNLVDTITLDGAGNEEELKVGLRKLLEAKDCAVRAIAIK